jgi:hypothetical protein
MTTTVIIKTVVAVAAIAAIDIVTMALQATHPEQPLAQRWPSSIATQIQPRGINKHIRHARHHGRLHTLTAKSALATAPLPCLHRMNGELTLRYHAM